MSDLHRIVERLGSAFHGPAWHGPSLKEALDGVTADLAARRTGQAHSILELVPHLVTWKAAVARRVEGEDYTPAPEDDFPVQASWDATLDDLARAQERLIAAVRGFDESRLGDIVRGNEYSFAFMLHGAADHDLYHAGQIAVLKKITQTPSATW